MQKLLDRHGFDQVYRAIRFLAVRLSHRPETRQFVAPVKATRAELRARGDAYDDSVDQRLSSSAEIVYCDANLDHTVVAGLGRDFLATFGESPKLKQLQQKLWRGVAPSAAMKPVATEEQASFVDGVIDQLETDAAFKPLRGHVKPIKAAKTALDAALAVRKKARRAENKADAELEVALDAARSLYNGMYPRLQLTFTNDPVLVESFFLELASGGRNASDATPPPTQGPTSPTEGS